MANNADTIDAMRRVATLEFALANLVEWAKGNRGSKVGNPYCIPEVQVALMTLAAGQGIEPENCNEVNTKAICTTYLGLE